MRKPAQIIPLSGAVKAVQRPARGLVAILMAQKGGIASAWLCEGARGWVLTLSSCEMAKRRGSAQEKAGSSTNVGPGSGGANRAEETALALSGVANR